MNSLNRTIEQDEIVVVKKIYLNDENQELEKRLFQCSGAGSGMHSLTSGRAVYGFFLATPEEKSRIEGTWINAQETEDYQREQVNA